MYNISMNKELNNHCSYCNKTIKYQSNWIKHCKTKKHLKKEKAFLESTEKCGKSTEKVRKSTEKVQKVYNCKYCDKTYSKKSSYYYHINKGCKVKKENEKLKKENEELRELLKNQNSNTTNNTTNNTQNITNNDNRVINIKVQGKEDLKNIIDADMYYKLGGMEGLKILELYLDKTYIHKEENNNIKYTNMRSNKCRTLQYKGDDKKWCIDNIDTVITKRIQTSPYNLNKMMKEHLRTLDEEHREMEESTRQRIHDKLYRITRMVYQQDRPHLLEEAKLTTKEKEGYKTFYEKHKMSLYNNTD